MYKISIGKTDGKHFLFVYTSYRTGRVSRLVTADKTLDKILGVFQIFKSFNKIFPIIKKIII